METKFGFDIDPATGEDVGVNSPPQHIRQTVEGSLKLLGVDPTDPIYRRGEPRAGHQGSQGHQ